MLNGLSERQLRIFHIRKTTKDQARQTLQYASSCLVRHPSFLQKRPLKPFILLQSCF
jgi:hypothetical protein